MANTVKEILLFAIVLFTLGGAVGSTSCTPESPCPPRPAIVLSPLSQRVNQTSPLRMICVAYLGREAVQRPTSVTWYTEAGEAITNSTQVTVYSTTLVRNGIVFMELFLEACTVYSDLIGEISCAVSNVGGEDYARWNITYDIAPPVIIVDKPSSQVVNYTSTLQMNCTAVVLRGVASDTTFTWWAGSDQIYNSTMTTIYTRRMRNGNTLYVESMLTISSVSYLHLGEFSCGAENSLGRDVVRWTVTTPIEIPGPNITITPTSTPVYFGGTVSATCTANVGSQRSYNIDPSMIMWLDAYDNPIWPATNQIYINNSMSVVDGNVVLESTLVISNIDVEHVGYLDCRIENAFGADYASIYVDTYEELTAPQILVSPVNQTVDCRSRVTLVCIINAFPSADIWWAFNDVYIDTQATDNANILESGVSRFGLNFSESYFDICEIQQSGHYKCIASNSLGNVTSSPVLVDIDLDTVPPLIPPTVTRKDRTSINEAIVVFEPQSPGSFEVTYYVANDSTTPYLTESVGSLQATIEQPQATLTGLDVCSRYWVIITGLYCTRTGSTQPMLIDLYSSAQYELTVTLGSKDGACNTWITEDPETKARDMEVGLQGPTSDCGFNIPCFEQSRWECTEEDPMKVTFKTQLIGHNGETAGQIKKCIDDWITAGLAKGQAFTIAGSNLTVINYTTTTAAPGESALPVWVWVVVGVGGALLVACLVTVLFLFAVCTKRRRSGSSFTKKERLVNSNNEDDIKDGDYTEVAVVDNPLYAEHEGDIEAYLKEDLATEHEEDETEDGKHHDDDDPKKTDI